MTNGILRSVPNESNCWSKQILRSLRLYSVGSSAFEIIWIGGQLQHSRFSQNTSTRLLRLLNFSTTATTATATLVAPLGAAFMAFDNLPGKEHLNGYWKPTCFWTSGLDTGFVCLAPTSSQTLLAPTNSCVNWASLTTRSLGVCRNCLRVFAICQHCGLGIIWWRVGWVMEYVGCGINRCNCLVCLSGGEWFFDQRQQPTTSPAWWPSRQKWWSTSMPQLIPFFK